MPKWLEGAKGGKSRPPCPRLADVAIIGVSGVCRLYTVCVALGSAQTIMP